MASAARRQIIGGGAPITNCQRRPAHGSISVLYHFDVWRPIITILALSLQSSKETDNGTNCGEKGCMINMESFFKNGWILTPDCWTNCSPTKLFLISNATISKTITHSTEEMLDF